MKIYLIRHGQTTGDVEDRYGGDYDDHLTQEGQEQAKQLAEKLTGKGIEKIFASSRIRAQETSKVIAEKLGVEVQTEPDLRERNLYGILSGMIISEAKEKYPKEVEMLKDIKNTLPNAEPAEHFVKRALESFWKISKEKYNTVAVVAHSGIIRRIYSLVLNIPNELRVGDCSFAELEVKGDKVELISEDGIGFK